MALETSNHKSNHKKIQDLLSVRLIYNFHNPSPTPSLKLISITMIKLIKFNSIKFIKIFIKLIYKILSNKFHKNSIKFLEYPGHPPQIYPKFTPNLPQISRNLGVDIIPGPFFPKFGGGRGGSGGVNLMKFGVNLG